MTKLFLKKQKKTSRQRACSRIRCSHPLFQTSREHEGCVWTKFCLQLLSGLSVSRHEPLLSKSFSLAFCQFSRLKNDLSDRSKPSGWDFRSLRKPGMPHWRTWHLHSSTQWIIPVHESVCWWDWLPVNWFDCVCQPICLLCPWVNSGSFSVLITIWHRGRW